MEKLMPENIKEIRNEYIKNTFKKEIGHLFKTY